MPMAIMLAAISWKSRDLRNDQSLGSLLPRPVKARLALSGTITLQRNLTVNVVCPGPTDTALLAGFAEGASNPEKLMDAFKKAIPLGRLGQPDDLAGAIVFLSSADSSFITGQVLSVSGGLTMHG